MNLSDISFLLAGRPRLNNHDELEAFPWRVCCLGTFKLLKTQSSVLIADFFLDGEGVWRNDVTGLLWTRVFDRN